MMETPKVKKEVHIVYTDDSKLPTFKFVGVWTGFDISTVQSSLHREYRRVKRDQRRAESSETRNISTKGEIE